MCSLIAATFVSMHMIFVSFPPSSTTFRYAGYVNHPDSKIQTDERAVLLTLVACRLSISYTLGMYSFAQDPENGNLLSRVTFSHESIND